MDISSTLTVDDILHAFVEQELLTGTGVDAARFWAALESILADFTPRNAELLARRDALQDLIYDLGKEPKGKVLRRAQAIASLIENSYLLP